jgi:hypothetical protein
MNWPLDPRKTYILIEAITMSLLIPEFLLLEVVFDHLAWGWRFPVLLGCVIVPVIVQMAIKSKYKPKLSFFVFFALATLSLDANLTRNFDLVDLLFGDIASSNWRIVLQLAIAIGVLAYVAEDVFQIVRPWMGWRWYPIRYWDISVFILWLALIYLLLSQELLPAPGTALAMVYGAGVLVALGGFWFLPLRWMPRLTLITLLTVSWSALWELLPDRLIVPLLILVIFSLVLDTVRKRFGPIYAIWARRKGLPVVDSDGHSTPDPLSPSNANVGRA